VVQAGTPAAQPVSVEYSSDYSFARQSGELTRGQLRTGKSAIAVSGAYDASGNSTVVHMKLDAPGVPLADIQALLPAFGVTLPAGSSLQGGTVKTNLSVDGPLDGLITTGELTMSDAKLAGFGLGSKLGALATFSGLKATPDTLIQVLSSNLRITPDGIALDSLNLVVPDLGTITGGGTIGQSQALNFKMRARLAEGGGIAGIASRSGLGGALGRDIPFLVQGTSSKPIILPDAAGMVKAGVSNLGQSIGTEQPKSVGDLINGIFGQQKKQ
jgi:AsmA protein